MKRFSLFLLLAFCGFAASAQTADEIMDQVKNIADRNAMQALITLTLVESDGTESARNIEQMGKKTADGRAQNIMIFHSPASVKNTRFLSIEQTDRKDDQWIYLPALGTVRRISASQGGESFMGTDFTYDDMAGGEGNDRIHTMLGEEELNGVACWKIQSTMSEDSDSQYGKVITWVIKEANLPLRIEIYDKSLELLKVAETGQYQKVQGTWTIIKNTMTNVQTGHSTRIEIKKLKYDGDIPNGVFTPRFLETGRP